jgi:LCP family protein required for cell wall assembly
MTQDPTTKPIHTTPKVIQHRRDEMPPPWREPPRKSRCGCCAVLAVIPILALILLAGWVYLTTGGRTNVLVLGIDSREDSNLGRSDTIILTTFIPSEPYVGMLSIPRDLWVMIPGYGPNRVNAAHFFAEADQAGTGPEIAMETVRTNFGVDVHHYLRLHHLGFLDLVDALGGIDVELPEAMSGYEAGTHHLNGEQALALVRDRAGSDDFGRMERGQIFLNAVLKRLLVPSGWLKIPATVKILTQYVETDIPTWRFPQLAFAVLRVGTEGIQTRIIDREMVEPFVSGGGAYVLAPKWEAINPVLMEIFGQ